MIFSIYMCSICWLLLLRCDIICIPSVDNVDMTLTCQLNVLFCLSGGVDNLHMLSVNVNTED